ncbi:hypothetical protein GCM10022255_106000 [Dactylosporangium darangshiense]|uniref:Hint domain-containing protein n=1 Tax=Dactylosporangium darangshiense TaxID=579108 RepID=A0ABP8DT82_9ACTN
MPPPALPRVPTATPTTTPATPSPATSPANPPQALDWDSEGHLTTVTDTTGVTTYIYDADGNRLIAKDPTGATAYLPGYELRKAGTTTTCTRYLGPATRTPTGTTWIASDAHGTGQLAIYAATLSGTRRKTDPFGNPRGTDPTWPNPQGFVGGIRDNTGLTHLGAREYEPATGRFISDDPITDPADPQQSNGYTYASNNPTTSSDPTGLWTDHDPGDYKEPPCSNPTMCDHQNPYGAGGAGPGSGSDGSGGSDGSPSDKDLEKANLIKHATALDVILNVGGKILLDLLGVTDMVNCFTKGDILACVNTLINVLPWGQIFKAAKVGEAAWRVGRAILRWVGEVKWAKKVLAEAERAATKADDLVGEADNLAGKACRRNSFLPGTPVLLADGTTKPIEDVDIGDLILATDPLTGQTHAEPVTILHANIDIELVDLTIEGPNGPAVLHTTAHHPFWNESRQRWSDAADLEPGDQLHTVNDTVEIVTSVVAYIGRQEMRNLTVADIHTY